MMSLRHGWGWKSPQTASPIHKTNTKSLSTLICCPLAYSFSLHSYTHNTFGSDWGFWARGSESDVITLWLRLTATSNCFSHPYWTYTKSLSTSICSPLAYCSSLLTQLYPHSLAQILGFWVTFNTKSCHYVMVEADSHLKLIASSILDIYKCLSALICFPLAYDISASYSYTHTTWLRFGGSGSLVEWKWCH